MLTGSLNGTRLGRIAAALAIAALSVIASAAPTTWQVDRAAIQGGDFWRLWTGHLVHASRDHWIFDVGAAALLITAVGEPRRWLTGFAWMAPLVSLLLLIALPSLDVYYGLSAVLHAWVVIVAGEAWHRHRSEGHGFQAGVAGLLGIGTLAKAIWEIASQSAPLTGSLDMGGPVVFASHLLGATCGAAAHVYSRYASARPER